MNVAGLIYLLIAHYLTGKGCLRMLRVELRPVPLFCLSMIVGVPLLSLVPCIIQLMNIPITVVSVYFSIALFTALWSIPLLINFKFPKFAKVRMPELYEWPFLIVCLALILISVWRCFYYPPDARDMLSGPELLAEFAVREKTMISSVFTIELRSTNNYFKSPFITSLQIIYKLLVSPFGQLWLSVLFLSFMAWIYSLLHERVHPVLAAFLLMLFFIIPDAYAYTYLILYDYSNMIFFFCGTYFLVQYMNNDRRGDLIFSALLFGFATYIRNETSVLVCMMLPVLLYHLYKQKHPFKNAIAEAGIFLGSSVALYALCMYVFVRNFIPIPFDVSNEVHFDIGNISLFFTRLKDMTTILVFSKVGVEIYGYFIFLFCGLVMTDVIIFRKFNREALIMLYAVGVVFIGLALLGYLIPLVDLMNTTKRGLFKALPLMLLYMANSPAVLRLSEVIKKWEYEDVQQKGRS